MNFRSLLVHLDNHERCSARVELAIRLVRRFEGHLVGLAPAGRLSLPLDIGPGLLGVDAIAAAQADLRSQAEERARRFGERCREAGLASFEAVVDEDDAAASVVRHGHCSDLVVIGQPEHDSADTALSRAMVEQVVLHSARPTLVVPFTGDFTTIGEKVLVAWDDSREAARAVGDALPLLARAQQVSVMRCETPLDGPYEQTHERLAPLQRWLAWHGVDAEVRLTLTEIDVGNALLSRAAELDADMIVMGAYGHSRWRERVLGGATRTMLDNMTVPVLMSH